MMGNAYNEAGGVFPRDVEMAFKYFEKSSAQGYKMATYNLAILYQSDEIKAKDDRHVRIHISFLSLSLSFALVCWSWSYPQRHSCCCVLRPSICLRAWQKEETRTACGR
jgi:TPR repeat protein